MLEESVTYAPSGGYPLYLTAKRYWLPSFEANANDPAALTLVFLHSTSFHKETWIPTLDAIFSLASSKDSPVKIREAWCLDCPNHGASAQLNAAVLLQPEFFLNCTRRVRPPFLSVGPDEGAHVDFRKRNLVGIGHSLGGVAITMLQEIEPVFKKPAPTASPGMLVKGAYERRDVWPDRKEAMALLKRRDRSKKWDPRILDIFVEYGIVEHRSWRPIPGRRAMYRDPDGATKPVQTLVRVCRQYPVHLILGGIADFVPGRVHKAIIDAGSYASVTTIENTGHLIVQEAPDRLGKAVYDALAMNARLRSKL
ncbi:Alpha/beta hydrolase fold-1 [Mycena galopus ATCC 62051]|nr:Alpha/beta hydrolase fold-1 [Mycena galopus ATCC 62051]